MNNLIIFGASGFVGKNLVLSEEGWEYFTPSSKECDLLDYDSVFFYLKQFIGKENLKILNLASIVLNSFEYKTKNVDCLYYNTLIDLNIMKAVKELGLKPYILFGSSMYGYEDSDFLLREDNLFKGAPSKNYYGYGVSKRFAAHAAESLRLDLGINCGVFLTSNMFGKNDVYDFEKSRVIATLLLKMKRNDPEITVYCNSQCERNFLYVKDFAEIIMYFLDWEINGVYNVGSKNITTIGKMAREMAEAVGYTGKLIFQDEKKPDKKLVNINNLYFMHNFDNTDFKDAIKETYEWLLKNS